MTKITLRAYNREIDVITDQGKVDVSIAHCLHVLKYFPKHVDTYRQLGKAYLESQRLGDAADVFQRVLSAVPDDFVSHIGMSIIREDEGNLNASIWHMQRAYDVQSSNITIQDELRRLYDRRDGIEPPKIRLSRAALARMYARGDLVAEAIAELRAALQDEPDRADLLVLLARMYAANQQRVKSIQTCSQILNKLPYCLEANLLIARGLEETNRAAEAAPYLDRARELDPYAAFISDQAPTIDQVPDAAVTLLKLDDSTLRTFTSAAESQPDWVTSLGTTMADEGEEEDIDWLMEEAPTHPEPVEDYDDFSDDADLAADLAASAAFGTGVEIDPTPEESDEAADPVELDPDDWITESTEASTEEIPDWMQEAGWEPASGEHDEGATGIFSEPAAEDQESPGMENPDESGLYRAQIPDWLQALAPSELTDDTSPIEIPADESESAEQESEHIPDWLAAAESESKEQPGDSDDLPDWLNESAYTPIAGMEAENEADTEQEDMEDLPDWLRDMPEDKTGVTLWLERQASGEEGNEESTSDSSEGERSIEMSEQDAAEYAEEESIPSWLADMGRDRLSAPQDEGEVSMEMPTEEPMEEPAEEPTEFTELDDDAAMRWLESLAAKQGASEEELLTSPDERTDEPPDWVRQMDTQISKPDPAETLASGTGPETVQNADDILDWEDFEADAQALTEVEGAESGDTMDWLSESEEPEAEFISQPEEAADGGQEWAMTADDSDEEDLPDWLKTQLEDEGGEGAPAGVPDWMDRAEDETAETRDSMDSVPDWLKEIAEQEESPAAQAEEGDVPDWLQQTMMAPSPFQDADEESSPADAPMAEDEPAEASMEADPVTQGDVPDWLMDIVNEEETEDLGDAGDVPDWLQQTMLAPSPFQGQDEEPDEGGETVLEMPEEEVEQMLEAESAEVEEEYTWERSPMDEMEGMETVLEADEGLETVLETDEPDESVESEYEPAAEMASGVEIEEEETGTVLETESEGYEPADWELDTSEFERPDFAAMQAEEEADSEFEEAEGAPAAEMMEAVGAGVAEALGTEEEPAAEMDEMAASVEPYEAEPVHAEMQEEVAEAPVEDFDRRTQDLSSAREALQGGDVESALEKYRSLIRARANLDKVIEDLNRALEYDHPVNVDIWAALGDAHAGNSSLQKALDAYTRAEELLK